MQEKEGYGCSIGDSLTVCQQSVFHIGNETLAEADQRNAGNEPEPMQISLDFAKSDTDEMTVQEELNSNLDSLVITGTKHAANSS